ncbi:hypothetical protein [Rhizobium mongolense]|uniref:hypothetical protein n=1 Tax=Rhizobium mongolense TaxID=57676 RepID=UPI0011133EE4|nr:hypothetical protein [Rhizobium mongolense]
MTRQVAAIATMVAGRRIVLVTEATASPDAKIAPPSKTPRPEKARARAEMQMADASMVSVIFRGAISGYAAKAGKHPLTLKPIAMLRKTKGNTIDRNLSKRTRAWQSKWRAICLPCVAPWRHAGAADILRSMLKEHAGAAQWRMSSLRAADG